ncbi:hypothetical protein J3458_017973 [Metarhizium acridum]|uniref:uncharacterized protein n=1 Tax=Metarhizium acridum TaxID=92637 RepID=UPI001C6C75B5|nr:hypothetical protein J3458_017973 [Metarhizium acridum]
MVRPRRVCRLQRPHLLRLLPYHAEHRPGLLAAQLHRHRRPLLRPGTPPKHDLQSVRCHRPQRLPPRRRLRQPALPDGLVALGLLGHVLRVPSVGLLGVFAIPATPPPTNPEHESSSAWQRVDVFGSAIGVAALALFNFAWNQGPVVDWPTPYT